MSEYGARSTRAKVGTFLGWSCTALGSLGAVAGLGAFHFGVVYFVDWWYVTAGTAPAGDAYVRGATIGMALLAGGGLLFLLAALAVGAGTWLVRSSAASAPFAGSPFRRRSGFAGGLLAVTGPPAVGGVGLATVGPEHFWPVVAVSATVFVVGLALLGNAVRAVGAGRT